MDDLTQKEIDELLNAIPGPQNLALKNAADCLDCPMPGKRAIIEGAFRIKIVNEMDSVIYSGRANAGTTVICLKCKGKQEFSNNVTRRRQ
jgi:hypothetical protein